MTKYVTGANNSSELTYDAVGNRTRAVFGGSTERTDTYTTDPDSNQLTSTSGGRNRSYSYDAYAYVGGNPVNAIDPFGLYCLTDQQIKAIAGGATGTVGGGIVGSSLGPGGTVIVGLLGGTIGGAAGWLDGGNAGFSSFLPGAAAGSLEAGSRAAMPGGIVGGVAGSAVADGIQSAGGHRALAVPAGGGVGGSVGAVVTGYFANATVRQMLISGAKGGGIGVALGLAQVGLEEAIKRGNDCGCE